MIRLGSAFLYSAISSYRYLLLRVGSKEIQFALPILGMLALFHLQGAKEGYVAQDFHYGYGVLEPVFLKFD